MTTTNAVILIVIASAIAYHCGKRAGIAEQKMTTAQIKTAIGTVTFDSVPDPAAPFPTPLGPGSLMIANQPFEGEKL